MIRIIFIFCVLVFFAGGARAGEYYTWTDEDGVVHMSNTPVAEPAKKAPIKKHAFDEASPAARAQDKREQDHKYKRAGVQADYQRRLDEIREDSAKREREYNAQRCTDARKREREYRYNWRNAQTQSDTDYWKRRLDEIEETCKKAGM